jgi:hypothetical protein
VHSSNQSGVVFFFFLLLCISDSDRLVILPGVVQLSWSKSLVGKWLNIMIKAQDVQVDCDTSRGNAIPPLSDCNIWIQ